LFLLGANQSDYSSQLKGLRDLSAGASEPFSFSKKGGGDI
jgi:hypothetical protein